MRNTRQKGFSLIELMIAMIIGLVLLGGIISVFSSSRKSFDLTQDLSVVQQSARYSIDEITRNIRIAGFQGCAFEGRADTSVQANVSPTTNLFLTAIQGAEISGSDWLPSRPTMLDEISPAPLQGSDVLMLQFGSPTTSNLAVAMNSPNANLRLINNNAGIQTGDLAIISDCLTSDIFRVSAATGAAIGDNITITHGPTVNANANLQKAYAPGSSLVANTTNVMRFNFNTYYVADTGRKNTDGDAIHSLYVYSMTDINNGDDPTELIEGVENMQLLYGMRNANGTLRYISADNTNYAPELIQSVQLGLLIASSEASTEDADSKTYDLLGTSIAPGTIGGTTPAHPEDHRIRMAFSTTVKIRNRRQP